MKRPWNERPSIGRRRTTHRLATGRLATGRLAGLTVGLALLVGACGGPTTGGVSSSPGSSSPESPASGSPGPTGGASSSVELTVLGAASLRDVLTDLAGAYEAAHPAVRVALTFDASSALRAQVEAGAAADVFASADTANPKRLVDDGLAVGPSRVFAGNELAIVTPVDDPGGITSPYDLARPGVRIVGAGPAVPISTYAARLIANLQAYRGAQAGLPDAIARNTVSREDNVRAVLAKIELGEGDAGIVYATDARGDSKVRVVPLPPGVNVRAEYAAVALASSAHPAEAAAFLEWLAGPEARSILTARGFLPPP